MTKKLLFVLIALIGASGPILGPTPLRAQGTPEALVAGASSPGDHSSKQALLQRYCVGCHNDKTKTADLSLSGIRLTQDGIAANAATLEKVVRKLRVGMMPPVGMSRPPKQEYDAFRAWIESELDVAAARRPKGPASDWIHRLNRAEYQNAVRDVLGVEVDISTLLPVDDSSYGFDNIADVLRMSPTLMERYLSAAKKIARLAVGTPPPVPNLDLIQIAEDVPQDAWADGLPFGTRGGKHIRYQFPVDGEYLVRVRLARQLAPDDTSLPIYYRPQVLEVSLDAERLAVFTLPANNAKQATTMSMNAGPKPIEDTNWDVRFAVKAGMRDLVVTFLNHEPPLVETLVEPYLRPVPTALNIWTSRRGAYVRSIEISGPFSASAAQKVRTRALECESVRADDAQCAKTVLRRLARLAYRRPVSEDDLAPLFAHYQRARLEQGSFEAGMEAALQLLLVSPEFLFRVEADQRATPSPRLTDLELASRLSFFLWSSIPDDELLSLASAGQLSSPQVLEKQVRRMLADSRSQALVNNFVGQWLYLRNVPVLARDPERDPDFDDALKTAFRRETELFMGHVLREDRSVLELLTADYSFVNERLAKHYGIPGIQGDRFRRVALPEARRGLLGQGSLLSVTSHPDKTSPVGRGKWILENILGTPPPEPPANVPALKEQDARKPRTMRERMEAHRQNPVCASCHKLMDPLGFALENFDESGRYRFVDEGHHPVDASGTFPDGTKIDGAAGLRQAILRNSEAFVYTLADKLLTYGLGRGTDYRDAPALRHIVRSTASSDYRIQSLILAIVKSAPFQARRSQS